MTDRELENRLRVVLVEMSRHDLSSSARRGPPAPAESAQRVSPDPAESAQRGSPDPSARRGSPDPAETTDRRSPEPTDLNSIGLDDDLVRVLGLDSLAALRLLATVEKRFGVRFPDERLAEFRTLRQLRDFIASPLVEGSR
jgi:acyl carrier protein